MTPEFNKENQLWLMLLGAMLVSTKQRDLAAKVIETADVPQQFLELWRAITSGQALEVKGAFRAYLPNPAEQNETCWDAMLRTLRELAMERYCSKVRTQMEFSKAITADQLLDLLDSYSSKIRCRKAALESAKTQEQGA